MMEHKFGTFQTVEELNRAAAAQKAEGDEAGLFALAAENGIDREDAEDYLAGDTDKLCTPLSAAIYKLKAEAKELDLKSQLMDWEQLAEDMVCSDAKLTAAVFSPDKKLADVIARAMKKASEARIQLSNELTKAAGIPTGTCIGAVSRREVKDIITDYYLGGDAK